MLNYLAVRRFIIILLSPPPLFLVFLSTVFLAPSPTIAHSFTPIPCSTQSSGNQTAPTFVPQSGQLGQTPSFKTPSPTPTALSSTSPCPPINTINVIEPIPGTGSGLRAQYFSDANFTNLVYQTIDSSINFNWGSSSPAPGIPANSLYAVRWTGQYHAVMSGYYQFRTYSDDGVRLWVDGKKVIERWTIHPVTMDDSLPIYMIAGKKYPIQLDYNNAQCCSAEIRLQAAIPVGSFSTVASVVLYPNTRPDTIGVWRASNKTFYLRNSNSTGFANISITLSYAQTGDLPIVGDWNGDGVDTVGVFRPSNYSFLLTDQNVSTSVADYNFQLTGIPAGSYVPIAGRWNYGMNYDGVGVYNLANGSFYLKLGFSTGAWTTSSAYGSPGARPAFGEYGGQGNTRIGVYYPSTANWDLIGITPFTFGVTNDQPVVGDWQGIFQDSIGLFRPDISAVYLKFPPLPPNPPYADVSFSYGSSGDQPVAGRWQQASNTCSISVTANSKVRFSPIQEPSSNDQTIMFVVNPSKAIDPTTWPSYTSRTYLWDANTTLSSTPRTIDSIEAVGKVGIIPWVSSTITWYRVAIHFTDKTSVHGYMGDTGSNITVNCNIQATPMPYPVSQNVYVPTTFAAPTGVSVFGDNQPPANMGSLGIHTGGSNGQPVTNGAGIDLVPRNVEFCIDTKTNKAECDPNFGTGTPGPSTTRIPVRSPVTVPGSCLLVTVPQAFVEIDLDCNSPNQTHRFLSLTHLTGIISGAKNAGDEVGKLCVHSERDTQCRIDVGNPGNNTPIHVALELYTRDMSTGQKTLLTTNQAQELLGFLAIPACIYNDWQTSSANPVRLYTSSLAACP